MMFLLFFLKIWLIIIRDNLIMDDTWYKPCLVIDSKENNAKLLIYSVWKIALFGNMNESIVSTKP